ncbi:MAG: hypothetical protein NZ700_10465 [Gemmataceae bacterium]|nr:hypothetical protein [Gemmataceae bacterium]
MAWLVGIDEAGYGPNLGPLVMTAAACRLPPEYATADLWELLRQGARRQHEADDGRLVVDDSKRVYAGARGLSRLEATLLGGVVPAEAGRDLRRLLRWASPRAWTQLRREPWFGGGRRLPAAAEPSPSAAHRWHAACRQAGIDWLPLRSVVVGTSRFNALLDRWRSKAVVLADALTDLLHALADLADEPVTVIVDKHGGRHQYTAMLQHALPAGRVLPLRETPARSEYRIAGLRQPWRIIFQPGADAAHLPVALASMFSKYLRELLMDEFNRFWQDQLPGLRPTAGYPADAVRFLEDIRPVLRRLGIAEETIWRKR